MTLGGSGRTKDSRSSWIFLAVTGGAICFSLGPFDNFGILLVVFVEYFNETNTKIGRLCSAARIATDLLGRIRYKSAASHSMPKHCYGQTTT